MQVEPITHIDFSNTALAFIARDNEKLRHLNRIYSLMDVAWLSKMGPKMLNGAFSLGMPIESLVRKTLFDIFCGGTNLKETVSTMKSLHQYGIHTILDYAVEGEKNESGFDATFRELSHTILHGGEYPEVAFVACKMTGLADFELMAALQAGQKLSYEQQDAWQRAQNRLEGLCKLAVQTKTPLFVDAEESWIQNPIDTLVEMLMERYNRDKATVYTTVQLYRHDRLAYLSSLIERAKEKGYLLGVKLVRGAYLEKETLRAKEMGYPNPMQASKSATDRDYEAALAVCVDAYPHVWVCAGTHNEASSLYLTRLLETKGISPQDPRFWFAQLLGMSDHISYNLSNAGYRVAKYVPFGPVKAVIPYLMRRAQENSSVQGQSGRELRLIRKEMQRRGM